MGNEELRTFQGISSENAHSPILDLDIFLFPLFRLSPVLCHLCWTAEFAQQKSWIKNTEEDIWISI